MLRQGFGTRAHTILQTTRRPSGRTGTEHWHKTVGHLRQISIVSDRETVLVERNAIMGIIMQSPGRHGRTPPKTAELASYSSCALVACIRVTQYRKLLISS